MPEVLRHDVPRKHATVDNELYEDFLGYTLGIYDYTKEENDGKPKTIVEYFAALKPAVAKDLNDYIVHRLAEVDPGYVPKEDE